MKTTIQLPIPSSFSSVIEVGQRIAQGDVLAKPTVSHDVSQTIHIAALLGVSPETIPQYCTKHSGDPVRQGEIIAQRKSLLSSARIKSPIDGRVRDIRSSDGTMIIESGKKEPIATELISPVAGKILAISATSLDIEVQGTEYTALAGEGPRIVGKLICFPDALVDTLSISHDVHEAILSIPRISPAVLSKLKALAVRGVVLAQQPAKSPLSWVVVDKKIQDQIAAHNGHEILLWPSEKKLVILA